MRRLASDQRRLTLSCTVAQAQFRPGNPPKSFEKDCSSCDAVQGGGKHAHTDHNVCALSASAGTLLWSSTTAQQVDSSPAVADGMVYITSIDGVLHAYGL